MQPQSPVPISAILASWPKRLCLLMNGAGCERDLVIKRNAPTPLIMSKRTSPSDAEKITVAADLEHLVQDKREIWRATDAKARRRQRRYKALLTQQLLKRGIVGNDDLDDADL